MVCITAFGALGLKFAYGEPGIIHIPLRGIARFARRETLRVSHGASRHWQYIDDLASQDIRLSFAESGLGLASPGYTLGLASPGHDPLIAFAILGFRTQMGI